MATKKSANNVPQRLTLRAYDVGFGDCFLLSIHYPRKDRHILIDFGSTRLPKPKSVKGNYMEVIAQQIAEDCDGACTWSWQPIGTRTTSVVSVCRMARGPVRSFGSCTPMWSYSPGPSIRMPRRTPATRPGRRDDHVPGAQPMPACF